MVQESFDVGNTSFSTSMLLGIKNYCIEVFNFLALYYYVFTQRFAEQMLWGCSINQGGKSGQNISADLCKDIMNHFGAVKSPKAISRAGKALGTVHEVLNNFDSITNTNVSSSHTSPSLAEDLAKVVEVLQLRERCVYTKSR